MAGTNDEYAMIPFWGTPGLVSEPLVSGMGLGSATVLVSGVSRTGAEVEPGLRPA